MGERMVDLMQPISITPYIERVFGYAVRRTFTREEAGQMRVRQGIRRGSLQAMLDNWRHRNYIEVVGEPRPDDMASQRFTKTDTYRKTHPQG